MEKVAAMYKTLVENSRRDLKALTQVSILLSDECEDFPFLFCIFFLRCGSALVSVRIRIQLFISPQIQIRIQ
jgi:hypothetical protein